MKDYVLTLLVAAAVTYVLTPLVRRFAVLVGAIKQPRERDVHTAPVPSVGGVAMFAGLAAALLVATQIPQLKDAVANTGMVTGLLAAGGLLVVIGFIDDRWGMNALSKAAGQIAAGGIVVATGTQLNWLPLPGGGGRIFIPTSDQATLLTILIVVATINAVNFIDGLDGLAAGIVAIAAISFFAYYYSLTKLVDISSLAAPALASAILIGMCLGFLPHNFSPAKIFMGDTGSMLLGLLLAYAPISSISSLDPAELTSSINRYPVIMPLLLPAVLLVIPYGDMLLAVVRRTRAGQSPFAPDRKHLHHRLLDIGHSQRASVLIMYLWAAAFSGTVVWLSIDKTERPHAANQHVSHYGVPVIVLVIVTLVAIAILLLLSMPWRRWGDQSGRRPHPLGEVAGAAATAAPARAAPAGAPPARVALAGPASAQPEGAPAQPLPDPAGLRRAGPSALPADPGEAERLAVATPAGSGETQRAAADLTGAGTTRPAEVGDAGNRDRRAPRPGWSTDWDGADGYTADGYTADGYTADGYTADGDGRSVAGILPPAADGGDWAWFRPAPGNQPAPGVARDR